MWRKQNPPTLLVLVQSLWKTVRRFLRKPKTDLPNDPAILLLGVYADKTNPRRDTHVYVHGSPITTAQTRKQSKRPLKDERTKKTWCIYTRSCLENPGWVWSGSGILLNHKKEGSNTIYSNMDSPREYHTKWNKSERDEHHLISLTRGISNMTQMSLSVNQKQRNGHREQAGVCRGKELGEGWSGSLGLADVRYYSQNG